MIERKYKCMFWTAWKAMQLNENRKRISFNDWMNKLCDRWESKIGWHSISADAIGVEARDVIASRFALLDMGFTIEFQTFGHK